VGLCCIVAEASLSVCCAFGRRPCRFRWGWVDGGDREASEWNCSLSTPFTPQLPVSSPVSSTLCFLFLRRLIRVRVPRSACESMMRAACAKRNAWTVRALTSKSCKSACTSAGSDAMPDSRSSTLTELCGVCSSLSSTLSPA